MNIAVVYVFPVCAGPTYYDYAMRFLSDYQRYPPGMEHQSVVVLNGTRLTSEITCLFSILPNCAFIEHDNSGYDIGAFQHAARDVRCDMMVFLGASTFFLRPGWLLRMQSAFQQYGNAQYGAMGNRGNLAVKVWPHIRTTAFWMRPELMNGYPKRISNPADRHPFEHGKDCFTSWVQKIGLSSWVVTWSRTLSLPEWDSDPNGFSRGDQSSLLAGDHMCEPPYYPKR